MVYILVGQDTPAKEAKIAELKKSILPAAAFQFDYEPLDAETLNAPTLKKALISLPAVAPQRLILIRNCHRLTAAHQELIIGLVNQFSDYAVLILDSDAWEPSDQFVRGVKKARLLTFPTGRKQNVFDMTRAMERHEEVETLKILNHLLGSGVHPLQIMGGLVWWWSKSRGVMSGERFKKGLSALKEADFHIKRSRLEPEYALEVLVVKLSLKEAG